MAAKHVDKYHTRFYLRLYALHNPNRVRACYCPACSWHLYGMDRYMVAAKARPTGPTSRAALLVIEIPKIVPPPPMPSKQPIIPHNANHDEPAAVCACGHQRGGHQLVGDNGMRACGVARATCRCTAFTRP